MSGIDIVAVEATVAAIVAVGTVLVGLWRHETRRVKSDQKQMQELQQHGESLKACEETLAILSKTIDRELRPNGGDSIRDRMIRVESQLVHLNKLLEKT